MKQKLSFSRSISPLRLLDFLRRFSQKLPFLFCSVVAIFVYELFPLLVIFFVVSLAFWVFTKGIEQKKTICAGEGLLLPLLPTS